MPETARDPVFALFVVSFSNDVERDNLYGVRAIFVFFPLVLLVLFASFAALLFIAL